MVKDCITCVSQLRTSAQSWRHSRAKPTGRSAPGGTGLPVCFLAEQPSGVLIELIETRGEPPDQ